MSTWDIISLEQLQTLTRILLDKMQAIFQQEVVAQGGRYYIMIIFLNV